LNGFYELSLSAHLAAEVEFTEGLICFRVTIHRFGPGC
jgi:hypothetical protein